MSKPPRRALHVLGDDGKPTGDVLDVPLFPVDVVPVQSTERQRRAPAVGYGRHEQCTGTKVPIDLQGDHYVWREHTYRTYAGTQMTCRASGVALHVAPAIWTQALAAERVTCPCEPEQNGAG